MKKQGKSILRSGLAGVISLAVALSSIPVSSLQVQAAQSRQMPGYELVYGVDCGDYDVTTPPAGEEFGTYQSVTEQVYGEDSETGKTWGIVDDYGIEAPQVNKEGSKTGGVDTDWTWPQETGGLTEDSPKNQTSRYTKNQFENEATFGTTRKLDYAFEVPAGEYLVEVYCTDPWGCSKYPSIYLNYGTDSQKDFGSYTAGNGNTATQSITMEEDGELTVNFRGTGNDTKAINIAYINVYQKQTSQEATEVTYEDIRPYYNVDCGDLDVTTAPVGEDFGSYQSVTEQIYGEDQDTGMAWGIVDAYGITPPDANKKGSQTGGIDTDWTWPQENGGYTDQSPKTSTNRYTKNQFESASTFGTTRKLDYAFELPAGSYDVEVLCVDPWGVSKSPSILLNAGTDAEVSFGSYTAGTVANKEITLSQDGELTVNFRGSGDATKAINVAYIMISNPEYKNLYKDYVRASAESTVRADFDLAQGTNGNTITWESDNENALRVEGSTAIVNRTQEDQTAVLSATISNGIYYVKKEISVTVKAASAISSKIEIQDFANEEVEITEDYYNNAFDKEVAYLTELDTDRLLAGFRETAAYAAGYDEAQRKEFMRNTTRYDGWENTRIGGHTLGHYMSSLARAYVNPEATEEQKAAIWEKADACAKGLLECQELTADSSYCQPGYLFGATIDAAGRTQLEYQFDRMEGKTSIGGDWVPWYTMHKILAGLVDVAKYTGSQEALKAAVDLGMWTYNRVDSWDATMKARVLSIEYGGMNDALYDLYELIVTDETYRGYAGRILRAAEQFDEITLFEAVNKGGANVLNGKHANTTIPKFIGALKRYIVLGEDEADYLVYAEKFWDMVINHHTYLTGGNSENEHFGADDILYGEETTVNCETCNTYNMLKLTRELFKITGDSKYSDYYENTLINAIMSSQNPETGMSMYFQPMATGYQKVFGKPTTDFWCCTGSGMENFTKLNDSIYFHMDDTILVNQYLSSVLTWEEKNVQITQDSGIQTIQSDQAAFTVKALDGDAAQVNLALRIPDWVTEVGNQVKVTVNGEEVSDLEYFDFGGKEAYQDAAAQNRYVLIAAKAGDQVTIQTPMEVVAHNLTDSQNTYAFKYGPVILSAKLGSDAAQQTEASHGIMVRRASTSAVSSDQLGIYGDDSVEAFMENINENLVRISGTTFRLQGANCSYDFVPHYSQYTDNYGIYWTYYVGTRDSESIIKDKDTNRKNRVTIDSLQAGYGQYEPGLDTSTGNVGSSTEHTRYATAGGYFEYEIKVDDREENYLLLTLRREDDGKPLYVTVGGETLYAADALDSGSEEAIQGMLSDNDYKNYYQIRISIPDSALDTKYQNSEGEDVVRFRFAGTKEEDSACLYNWSYCVRGYRTTNSLTALTVEGEEVDPLDGSYSLNLSAQKDSFEILAEIADTAGYVTVNGEAIEEGTKTEISLTGYEGDYEVVVYAESFEPVSSFVIHVKQDTSGIDFSGNIKRYYSFDETLGDALTVQKATIPSQISKTVSYTDGAKEDSGKALKLDGTYGLQMGNANDLGESYTVSYWMKPDSLGSNVDPTFCAGVFNPEYWFSATCDGKLWSYQGGYIATTASNAYKNGEWQYVTIVVDGNQAGSKDGTVVGTLYVNGQPVSKGDVASGIMTNSNALLYFGVNRWDNYFKGEIDDLLMLDVALSQREVRAFMDGTIGTDGKVNNPGSEEEEIQNAKKDLSERVSEAASYEEEDYTAESYQILKNAVEAANTVLANEQVTLKEITDASQAITDAIAGLVKLPTEEEKIEEAKKSLNEKISQAASYKEGDYTAESYSALKDALEAAGRVYADTNATLEQVTKASQAVADAIGKLVKVSSGEEEAAKQLAAAKAALQSKINQTAGYRASDYTAQSYAALSTAVNAAKALLTSSNATLSQINAASVAIDQAVKNLQKAAVENKPVSYAGKTVKIGNYKYKITKHSSKAREASFAGVVKKKGTVKIPATVTYKGIRFKVTGIQAKAMQNNKKVKTLVIGKNVRTIGAQAFYGCRNLKSIQFKGKQVKKIKKGAFLKIKANAKVKMPKAVRKKYKGLLNKKVISQ